MKRSTLQRKPLKVSGVRVKRKNLTTGRIKRSRGGIKPKKRKKRGEDSKLTEALWEVTRQLVFKTYGTDCYTCYAKNLSGKNLQGGHMPWASAELSMACRYDIRFIRPQCMTDNIHYSGRHSFALDRMRKEGINTDELWSLNLATKGKTYGRQWKRDKITEYTALLTNSKGYE